MGDWKGALQFTGFLLVLLNLVIGNIILWAWIAHKLGA